MNARRTAYSVLSDVLEQGAYASLRLKKVPGEERAFVSALVYTALDRLLLTDYYVRAFAKKPPKRAMKQLLRLGMTELLYMTTPPHAVLHEYGELAKRLCTPGEASFLNALLRRADRERDCLPALPEDPVSALSLRASCPPWLTELFIRERGMEDAAALLTCGPLPVHIRPQYPCTAEELLGSIPSLIPGGQVPFSFSLPAGTDPLSLPGYREGRVAIQGEGASLACMALGDCRERTVLDACAAPGGKAACIASLSENTARITCTELHPHRCELMRETFSRLHVSAEILQRDATVPDEAFRTRFDAVLADVPCSGLGLLWSKPDIRYRLRQTDVETLLPVQAAILDACAACVKPGGILAYATCTVSRRENEEQIAAFLSRHSEFRPDPLPFREDKACMLQLLPHVHRTEGFFIARMRYVPDRANL